jgi:D-alanyl-D-alanine carboxypeptidase/D-alanyl-D-alanine-endopeptidase (penicillin-binding protein 4)
MLKPLFSLCLALYLPLAVSQPLPDEVQLELRKAKVPLDAVSFSVKTLEPEPKVLLAYREQEPMNPASVMKLVTTFAGLDQLGPQFTWKTRYLADGPLEQGVVRGNLFIKGGGDPKWVLERIAGDFRALRAKGLDTVEGDIVLDRSIFELPAKSPASFDGEGSRPYNATPDGLLVNFKSLMFTIAPDPSGKSVVLTTEPPMADVEIHNGLHLASGPCGDWRNDIQVDLARNDLITMAGRYRASCGERSWTVAHPDPDQFALKVVKALYLQSGATLKGQVRYGTTGKGAVLLHEGHSLPLSAMIADINKFSNNVMAQQLFLTLGLRARAASTYVSAQQALSTWWRKALGKVPPPELENGSGLSRHERISAYALSELLEKAAEHPNAAVFEQSLGVVGVDGTVKLMGLKPNMAAVAGRANLKTGTLKDVIAIAGYVTSANGIRFRVVALINHPNAPNARPVFDALLNWVVRDNR